MRRYLRWTYAARHHAPSSAQGFITSYAGGSGHDRELLNSMLTHMRFFFADAYKPFLNGYNRAVARTCIT
jgi:hypothetical protein